ncbi:MAG: tRNA guanosine(34) transglycosylase Tgt [Candidatus Parcubacteria bacterium]|nr:tRNA guanosine(34) transglycosylase Tgt [Candidatus Parcubacteria bacterium]
MSAIDFKIEKRAPTGRARAGSLTTPHGVIHTPAFVPVGTKANVKGILPSALAALGAEVVLANTYHLYLQPGEKIIEAAGGLAKFMNWKGSPREAQAEWGPTMTDSGGFQVFSLGAAFGKTISKFVKEQAPEEEAVAVYDESVASQHGQLAVIDDEGVSFTSHLDGSLHRFTPERSVEIQHALGADMFFAFDECTSPTEPYEYQKEAMDRTHRWAERSLKVHRQNIEANKKQAIFGIVQGGRHEDLRKESAREIASLGFDGIGIGGSFSKEDMRGALSAAVSELPEELPRHFLGIGEPSDVLEGIASGMDLFDCVAATRIGRHGSIYTKRGIIHLRGEKHQNDFSPLDPEISIPGTEGFTRAYVSHLVRSGEMLGSVICSMHNVGFILDLVKGARRAILDGRFDEYRADFVRTYYHG